MVGSIKMYAYMDEYICLFMYADSQAAVPPSSSWWQDMSVVWSSGEQRWGAGCVTGCRLTLEKVTCDSDVD